MPHRKHGEEENIFWFTCPECQARIGIFLTLKIEEVRETPEKIEAEPPSIEEFVNLLRSEDVDLSLVLVLDEGDKFTVSPRGYISGSWRPVNEAIRKLGGRWVSAGKRGRWEIDKKGLIT